MKILVSACLLGRCCKYNGKSNYHPGVKKRIAGREIIEVCPEALAGLGTPRTPIELVSGRLMDRDGRDVDTCLREAVEKIMAELDPGEIEYAILQPRSPTCGAKQVYDGTFSGVLIPGTGVFAQALMDAGIPVVDAGDVGAETNS